MTPRDIITMYHAVDEACQRAGEWEMGPNGLQRVEPREPVPPQTVEQKPGKRGYRKSSAWGAYEFGRGHYGRKG